MRPYLNKLWILTLLFMGLSVKNVFAQNTQIDSLKTLLESATHNHRVDVLLALCDEHYEIAGQMETMKTYAELALEQAEQLDYKDGKTRSFLNLARYYSYTGEQLVLFNTLQTIDSLLINAPVSSTQIQFYLLQARFYRTIDTEKTLDLQFKALSLSDSANHVKLKTKSMIDISHTLHEAKDVEGAIHYLEQCWDLAQMEKDSATIGVTLGLLGGLIFARDTARALELLQLAELNLKAAGNHREMSSLMLNIGVIHAKNRDLVKAKAYLNGALQSHPSIYIKFGIHYNFGHLYRGLGDRQLELQSFESSRAAAEEAGNKSNQIAAHYALASSLYKQGRYRAAMSQLHNCLALKDSLGKETVRDKLALQEALLKQKTQKREIELLQQRADAQTYRLWIYVLVTLLLSSAVVFGAILYHQKKKQRFEIKEQLHEEKLKTIDQLNTRHSESLPPTPQPLMTIPVLSGSKMLIKNLQEIVLIQADANLIFAVDQQGKRFVVEQTLTELEKQLPDYFIRVHRSHIINKTMIRSIKRIESNRFQFVMDTEIDINLNSGRAYRDRIRETLNV